jgi:hypothetical protein
MAKMVNFSFTTRHPSAGNMCNLSLPICST